MALCRVLAKSFPTPSPDLVHPWEARSPFPRWGEARKGLLGGITVGESNSGWTLWALSGDCEAWETVSHAGPPALSSWVVFFTREQCRDAGTYGVQLVAPMQAFLPRRWTSRSKPQSMQTAKFQPLLGQQQSVPAHWVREPDCP